MLIMESKDRIVMLDLSNVGTMSHIIISAVHIFHVAKWRDSNSF